MIVTIIPDVPEEDKSFSERTCRINDDQDLEPIVSTGCSEIQKNGCFCNRFLLYW